ncbi:MAG TPA: PHP domain-containing protein [Dehalococcoidales bacterium]|nr:PHP domain-containing protein [Dehalococcoidales bacterium]
MSKVDIHIHSTASDGRLTPEEVVRKSAEIGLTVIALCDHDTVDGIAPALTAARAFPWLKVIPGIEVSTDVIDGEAHILGYFIDYTDPKLLVRLEGMRNSRRGRAQKMVAKLGNLGIKIEWQRVQEIAGSGSMGRPHIAQAMLEKGYISSIKEAFTDYISRDGPAYAEREKITPAEAVDMILQAKGLPVLAHPLTTNDPETMIIELKQAGLIGIEAYYDDYTADEVGRLAGLANKHNVIATGGSDYHGLGLSNETMLGGVEVPIESAEQLIALAKQRGRELT